MRRAARRRTSLLCAVARALAVAALASSVSLSPSGADAARAPTTTRPSGRAPRGAVASLREERLELLAGARADREVGSTRRVRVAVVGARARATTMRI